MYISLIRERPGLQHQCIIIFMKETESLLLDYILKQGWEDESVIICILKIYCKIKSRAIYFTIKKHCEYTSILFLY